MLNIKRSCHVSGFRKQVGFQRDDQAPQFLVGLLFMVLLRQPIAVSADIVQVESYFLLLWCKYLINVCWSMQYMTDGVLLRETLRDADLDQYRCLDFLLYFNSETIMKLLVFVVSWHLLGLKPV